MLDHDPLEERRAHLAVPHTFRINDDNGAPTTHTKAWRFAALDPRGAEEESLALEQTGEQRVQLATAPIGRAEATGTHQDVSRVRFHEGRVSMNAGKLA
jgi:hypothetical protein